MDAPKDHKLIAAVARPAGAGPFPVIVWLHGGGGFFRGDVDRPLHRELVSAGFMVVSGCWFLVRDPAGSALPNPNRIDCPNAPAYSSFSFASFNRDTTPYAAALVRTARTLPAADGQRVGVYGISRGATAAPLLASTGTAVQAIVAESGSYTPRQFPPTDSTPLGVVKDLTAPILILHGTADPGIPIRDALEFEPALRQFNKPYELHFYEGAGHSIDADGSRPEVRADATARTIGFFKKHLGKP